MPRPPLPVGTHGKVAVVRRPAGFLARAKYRDYDGVTRLVERSGKTGAAARNRLLEAIRDRAGPAGTAELAGESRFSVAAALWLAQVQAAADLGELSPNTAELYERQLRNHVLPALGALRLREVTVPRVEAFLRATRKRHSAASTKTIRSVVSGVMGLAARHGAVATNPTKEVSPIKGDSKRAPRALTATERARWLAQLEADEQAVRHDLPDLTRWMLATGVRIGEALAVSWDEVDLTAATVDVEWNLIRVKGEGLRRVLKVKTPAGERTLPLPLFAVEMLERRARDLGHTGPLFPDSRGGWRDPSNTRRALRDARGTAGFAWVTSHVFRKTCASILDDAGASARAVADQLGHSRPSMTQDVYLGRKVVNPANAAALDAAAGS